MPITYDPTLAAGQVRLLCADTREDDHIFEDAEIDAFLSMEGDVVKRAAAAALEVIASNESLVQKRITLLDLHTDGPAVAADLRKHAASLRAQADAADVAGDGIGFAIVEHPDTVWAEREYLTREALRQ